MFNTATALYDPYDHKSEGHGYLNENVQATFVDFVAAVIYSHYGPLPDPARVPKGFLLVTLDGSTRTLAQRFIARHLQPKGHKFKFLHINKLDYWPYTDQKPAFMPRTRNPDGYVVILLDDYYSTGRASGVANAALPIDFYFVIKGKPEPRELSNIKNIYTMASVFRSARPIKE